MKKVQVRKLAVWAALALFAGMGNGCLQYDGQTIYMEHQKEEDRLLLVINYQGLYHQKSEGWFANSIDDTCEELKKVVDGRTIMLGNSLWAFSPETMRQELMQDPPLEHEPHVWKSRKVRRSLLVLLDRIHVYNGGFYSDPAGRICWAQVVVIERAEKSIDLVNSLINEIGPHVVEEEKAARGPGPEGAEPDQDELLDELFLEWAAKGHSWLKLEGNSITISVPLPEEVFEKGRHDLMKELFSQPAGKEDEDHLLRLQQIFSNPILFWYEGGLFKLKYGLAGKPSSFTVPSEGKYVPNLKEHIAETYGFKLDSNLAFCLVEPERKAEAEAQVAAKIMAPRLTKEERIRVLLSQLKTRPSVKYWVRLREEELPGGDERKSADIPSGELSSLWEKWLTRNVEVPKRAEED